MRKQKWFWLGIVLPAVLALGVWGLSQRQGAPILERGSLREILYVQDYRQGYADMADVTEEIDGERLARLPETYQRRRGGSAMRFWRKSLRSWTNRKRTGIKFCETRKLYANTSRYTQACRKMGRG